MTGGMFTKTYAVRVVKRLKQEERQTVKRDHYVNLDVIPGTSVNCERLFSLAKHIMTDTRKITTPILFEALLLLKVNYDLWDAYSVGKAMGRTRHDATQQQAETGEYVNQHVNYYNRGGSDDEYGDFVDDCERDELEDDVSDSVTVGDSVEK